jgi:hypothetical protein
VAPGVPYPCRVLPNSVIPTEADYRESGDLRSGVPALSEVLAASPDCSASTQTAWDGILGAVWPSSFILKPNFDLVMIQDVLNLRPTLSVRLHESVCVL